MTKMRQRGGIALALGAVIAVGLFSRSAAADVLPACVGRYAGDTLWALALFLGLRLLSPRSAPLRVAVLTGGLALAVELSQLYQAAWLNTLRATRPGALLLGHGFMASDLLCYAFGCTLGVGMSSLWVYMFGVRPGLPHVQSIEAE